MKTLLELNQYLHDFTAAMWVAGSILLWMILREARRGSLSPPTGRSLADLAGRLMYLTIPALIINLGTGGVRAATFARYEHTGEITSSVITTLIVKHIAFAVVVAWGIWIHFRCRSIASAARD